MKRPYFNKEERQIIYLNTLKSDLMLSELTRLHFCKILYKQVKPHLDIIFNVISFLLFYSIIFVWMLFDVFITNFKKLIR